ncbi:MAG TPA: NAD(+) synthase [Polyangiaceae bacterium]|nr:NAD(+) synthase [Polyangiaceae bacterium]
MKLIKVAAATVNQTPLDWDGNRRRIAQAISHARREQVGLLCLPELCITGYGCEDAFLSPGTHRMALEVLTELVPETQGMLVCFGLPMYWHKAVYNACCLVADRRVLGFVAKRVLAGDGIHYEPRWFKPWPEGCRTTWRLGESEFPAGDLVFEVAGVRIGFEICEDAWTSERPGANLAQSAVDVILNPSASHFAFGKHEVRRRLVVEGARAFGVTYVYSNLLGNEAGRVVYDGDALIATERGVIASATRFSAQQFTMASAVVDVESAQTRYAWKSSHRPTMAAENATVRGDFAWPVAAVEALVAASHVLQTEPVSKFEEFTRAIALGLFDYLRKSRSNGFVVSLSGGADSSAIACLVHLMVRLVRAELGDAGLQERLGYLRFDGVVPSDDKAWTRRLLTTAYQATKNSSAVTRDAARSVAEAIGARHLELSVDDLVEGYQRVVSGALDRRLDWATDDLALQNIQARARAPSVWLIANLEGALLLATSNRSEAAVGYATMDGDTAGGLSPIAGIDKAFIRRWLVWLEQEGLGECGPIPALRAVNVQAPTAELRPKGAAQTDEADLMPYEVLDVIERASIADKRAPADVLRLIEAEFPAYSTEQLLFWLERFYALFCRNQWKRERYAPSFHVDDANLDPKTWCRFPILSGAFARELAELRESVRGPGKASQS